MLGMTFYLTQAASDKNSLLHLNDVVCWQWQYVPAHGNGSADGGLSGHWSVRRPFQTDVYVPIERRH